MQHNIDVQHGSRFERCNVITQFFYNGAGITRPWAQIFNMPPEDFDEFTHKYIVAVWHIKPKH